MKYVKSLAQAWSYQNPAKSSIFVTIFLTVGIWLLAGNSLCAQSAPLRPTWKNFSLTLYRNMALVRDQTRVDINKDKTVAILQPVSTKIIPQSVTITLEDANILEQSYSYRPITPENLLESFVGKDVLLINTNKKIGIEEIIPATLIAAKDGVVLKVENRIETSPPGRIAFPFIPQDLSNSPMLKIVLKGKADKEIPVELAYLTKGIGWKADYVAVLDESAKDMELASWVTIRNHTGISFNDASIQLVAGDINEERADFESRSNFLAKAVRMSGGKGMEQERLFEYHLYSVKHRLCLKDGQMKQLCLFSASQVPYEKHFLVKANDYPLSRRVGERKEKLPVQIMISFKNDDSSRLGMPLPQGDVRVYERDSKGILQFIGRDYLFHVPKGEIVRLNLGKAFDLLCTRTQTDFRKFEGTNRYKSLYESSYKITIKNAKKEPATVTYQERLSGDWKITKENLPHVKLSAATAAWSLNVPPGKERTLTFRVRTRY